MARVTKPPQERRDEILKTALALFMEKGYENTSVGDIVEKIGVAQGLFYYYFRSKEEVYRAAMEKYADDCTAEMIAILTDGGTLWQRIDRAFSYMEGLIDASAHALMDAAARAAHIDMDDRFSIHVTQSLIEPAAGILEDLNERGRARIEDPELAATFILFGIFGLIHGNLDHDHDPAFFRAGAATELVARVLGLTPDELKKM